MKLRVIDFGLTTALRSQAVYHGLAENMRADADPILSLVSPETPYVCVGMHQEVAKEVDEDFCREHDLPIIRRHVGGGAVYLDHNQLFTHFIYPHKKAPEYAVNLYPRFIEPVVRTYRDLGVEAAFRPVNDIQVNGRKIGGTGAASIGEATVMVGSFMFDFDTETMSRCLKVPSEKFRDKLYQSLNEYMTTMIKELGTLPERARVKETFLKHCADVLEVEPVEDTLTDEELAAIERAETALADPEWTHSRGRKFVEMGVKIAEGTHLTEAAYKAPAGMLRVHLLERSGQIEDLMVSGDFTCLPADGMDQLAERLKGESLDFETLQERIDAEMLAIGAEMPGITAKDIATVVMQAAEGAS